LDITLFLFSSSFGIIIEGISLSLSSSFSAFSISSFFSSFSISSFFSSFSFSSFSSFTSFFSSFSSSFFSISFGILCGVSNCSISFIRVFAISFSDSSSFLIF